MKSKELRDLSAPELENKVRNLEEEHFNLRFQSKMKQLSNPLKLRMVRRDIGRAKTIIGEKKRTASTTAK